MGLRLASAFVSIFATLIVAGLWPEYAPHSFGVTVVAFAWFVHSVPRHMRHVLWRFNPVIKVTGPLTIALLIAMMFVSSLPQMFRPVLKYSFPIIGTVLLIACMAEVAAMVRFGFRRWQNADVGPQQPLK